MARFKFHLEIPPPPPPPPPLRGVEWNIPAGPRLVCTLEGGKGSYHPAFKKEGRGTLPNASQSASQSPFCLRFTSASRTRQELLRFKALCVDGRPQASPVLFSSRLSPPPSADVGIVYVHSPAWREEAARCNTMERVTMEKGVNFNRIPALFLAGRDVQADLTNGSVVLTA